VNRRCTLAIAGVALVVGSILPAAVAAATSNPGELPQTTAEPSFATPLTHQMQILATAIKTDSPNLGETVFFPSAAYVNMKTGEIPAPASDYVDRLIAFYKLDLEAYQERLYTRAKTTFVRVRANPADAAWISPGVCENRIGYWHVPGVRLEFIRDSRVVSVAVASLISWRGVWYVVHLGPNVAPWGVGKVDDFSSGIGVPGPAGGC
jgi:hypothetical protein